MCSEGSKEEEGSEEEEKRCRRKRMRFILIRRTKRCVKEEAAVGTYLDSVIEPVRRNKKKMKFIVQ